MIVDSKKIIKEKRNSGNGNWKTNISWGIEIAIPKDNMTNSTLLKADFPVTISTNILVTLLFI